METIALAARGFNVREDVARMQASLTVLAITFGQEQLSPNDN